MTTLLIGEYHNDALADATLKAASAAAQLGAPVHLLIAGAHAQAAADHAATLAPISKVLHCDDAAPATLAESVADLVVPLAENYTAIMAAATTHGKNIAPRIAALLDVAQISDITAVLDKNNFERPIYAGNAVQTVQSAQAQKVITIRATAFPAAPQKENGDQKAEIETLPAPAPCKQAEHISDALSNFDRPELTSARVIIAGGRALGSAENFTLLEKIADPLNAAIGASRAAVDAGFISNDCQIGQTGKIVAPELYIAVGISGAIQHLAGIQEAKTIVAINKDAEAPIFQIADYGLVGDLFTILPELETELKKLGL